ncbi:MAG: PAS domain S-box protein, partial [Methyloceanibacter sp.]
MHFTGMLAFSLPVPVYYDVPTVVVSYLAAVAASAAALHVASRERLGAWAWWTGSVLMGGGIGVMHYTGMLALRLPGTMHHAPAMVALSVVLAVVVALVALRLTFKFRDGTTGGSKWRKPVSALVMGLAIPVLHYAAMAGASFISGDTLSGDLSHAVGSAQLGGTALIVGTVVVLGLALLAAYADRRITAARQEKQQALRHSEARLRAILEAALDCIITIDHEGCIVEFNPAAERTLGHRRAEVIGKEMAALMIPPALREAHRRSLATGEGPLLDGRREIRLLRADGTEIPAEIAVTRIGVEEPPLYTAYLRDIADQKAAQQALEATRARLQHLLVSSPTVIYSTAATGDYACSFMSENLLELIGYQAAELLNDKDFWLERVHPDDKTRVLAEFEDTVPRERGAFEYRFLHKDGRYRWIQDSYRLTRGTEGQPLEIIGSWIDITARKETEAQRDRFFSLSPDLLCIAGTDGYFKRVNPAFGQTLGWSDEELLARPLLDFVHAEDVAATLLEVERLKTGQPTLQFENRYRCKNGGWRWLAWKAVAHPDGLLYSAARDVTGQREANRQLEQAKADAEQASRAKSAFLATMSHEIRTPMNGVIGMAEVLAQSNLSAQQAELVTIIGASASALLGIIDDILYFSKIEAGRLEIERAPVPVADLVEEICNSLVPVAARGGVVLALFVS